MKIEVSNGEILDKYSILEIKKSKIKDKNKLHNINKEIKLIYPVVKKILSSDNQEKLKELYSSLLKINYELWIIEDKCRELEAKKDFGEEFISTARSVYITNDKRSLIKKNINILSGSLIVEEKGYNEYNSL